MSKIFKISEAERSESPGNYRMSWLAGKSLGAKNHNVVQYEYEPNWRSNKLHYHRKRESLYLIVEGEAAIHLNGEEYIAGPGTAAFLSPGDVHGVVSTGRQGLKMVEVWSPIDPDIEYVEDQK